MALQRVSALQETNEITAVCKEEDFYCKANGIYYKGSNNEIKVKGGAVH